MALQRLHAGGNVVLRKAPQSERALHSFQFALALEAPTGANVGQFVGAAAEGGVGVAALAGTGAPPVSFGTGGHRSRSKGSAAPHTAGPNPLHEPID